MKPLHALAVGLALSAGMGCAPDGHTAASSGGTGGAVDDCAALARPTVVDDHVCVTALTADSTYVYWVVDDRDNLLLRAQYPGAHPETLVPTSPGIDQILARSGKIYWVEDELDSMGNNLGPAVKSMSPDGSNLVTLLTSKDVPQIALNDTTLFAAEWGTGNTFTVPLTGGPPVTLVSGRDLGDMLADGDFLYALDDQHVPYRVPVGGGAPEALSLAITQPVALLGLDGAYLDVIVGTPLDKQQEIQRVPLDGGAAITIAQTHVTAATTDATNVYWIGLDHGVYMAPLGGGPSQKIACIPPFIPSNGDASNGASVDVIAVDATSVYFPSPCGEDDEGTVSGSLLSVPIPRP